MKNFLDIDGNGYIEYKDFAKRFGPTMSLGVPVP